MRHTVATLLLLLSMSGACGGNMMAASLATVPPVHRVAVDVQGATILVAEDPEIETRDPVHIQRARENRVPQQVRAAMQQALELAGFRVVTAPGSAHDLVAKLALNVSEGGEHAKQTYRCGLRRPDGAPVAQIDWTWPEGTFVEESEVFEFASHNLATEVARSRAVVDELRRSRATPAVGAEGRPSP